jgi:hypothetical protein
VCTITPTAAPHVHRENITSTQAQLGVVEGTSELQRRKNNSDGADAHRPGKKKEKKRRAKEAAAKEAAAKEAAAKEAAAKEAAAHVAFSEMKGIHSVTYFFHLFVFYVRYIGGFCWFKI